MKLIVCLDDKGGMAFAGRRQSRDRLLCNRICEITGGSRVLMSEPSYKLFENPSSRLVASPEFLKIAGSSDYCFTETDSPAAFAENIEEIIIYRWNRVYPSDLKFDIPLDSYTLKSTYEFKGNSHDKITEEVYTR